MKSKAQCGIIIEEKKSRKNDFFNLKGSINEEKTLLKSKEINKKLDFETPSQDKDAMIK